MEKFLGKSAADKSQNKARVEYCPRMEESWLASACQAAEHSQRSTRSVLSCMIYAVRLVHRTPLQYKYQNPLQFPQFYHNNPAIVDKIRNIPRNLWHFTSQLFPRYFRNVSASFWRDRRSSTDVYQPGTAGRKRQKVPFVACKMNASTKDVQPHVVSTDSFL